MKKALVKLILLLLLHLNVNAQNMDTDKIENSIKSFVTALKEKSFTDFKKVLFNKEDYIFLIKEISGNSNLESSKLDEVFQELNLKIENFFFKLLQKEKTKGFNGQM